MEMVKQDLIKKLKEIDENRDIVFNALDFIRKPKEIREFYRQYVGHLRESGIDEETKANPERIANKNIRYALGLGYDNIIPKWEKVIGKYFPYFLI